MVCPTAVLVVHNDINGYTCCINIRDKGFMVYCSPSLNPLSTGWDNEIDIQKTIQLVRAQRSGMVQTEVRVGSCSVGGWPLHYHRKDIHCINEHPLTG